MGIEEDRMGGIRSRIGRIIGTRMTRKTRIFKKAKKRTGWEEGRI